MDLFYFQCVQQRENLSTLRHWLVRPSYKTSQHNAILVDNVPKLNPVSVVINGFYPKTGACVGAEHLLTLLAAEALVINIFLPPPVLFSE